MPSSTSLMPPPSNAVENNSKLFPIVATKLSQKDPAIYAAVAQKFGQWLSNEKAYYAAARPEIIKLLGIAHTSLRRAVGADVNPKAPFHISTYLSHPMIGPYSRLLGAVHPYKHLFIEEDLQERLRNLFNTIMKPNALSTTPSTSTASMAIPQSRSASLPKYRQNTTMQPSSSSLASALEMRPTSSTLTHGLPVYIPPNGITSQAALPPQIPHPIPQASTSGVMSGSVDEGMGGSAISPLENNLLRQGPVQALSPVSAPQGARTDISPHPPGSGMPLSSLPGAAATPAGRLPTDSREISPALSPMVPTKAPGDIRLPVKPKKKKKRPLPSDILAKDIEELNRKRSMHQESREFVKKEPTEATEFLGETGTSTKVLNPHIVSKKVIPQIVQSPVNDLASNELHPETRSSNETPLPPPQGAQAPSEVSAHVLSDRMELDQPEVPSAPTTESHHVISDRMELDQPEAPPASITEPETSSSSASLSLSPNQLPQVSEAHTGVLPVIPLIIDDQNIMPNTSDDVNVEMADSAATNEWQEAQTEPPPSVPADGSNLRVTDDTLASQDYEMDHEDEPQTPSVEMGAPDVPSTTTESLLSSLPGTTASPAIQLVINVLEGTLPAPVPIPSSIPRDSATSGDQVQAAPLKEPIVAPMSDLQSRSVSKEVEPQTHQPACSFSPSTHVAIPTSVALPKSNVNSLPLGYARLPAVPAIASPEDPRAGNMEEVVDMISQKPIPGSVTPTVSVVPFLEVLRLNSLDKAVDEVPQQPTLLPISATSAPVSIPEVPWPETQGDINTFGSEMRMLAFQRGLQSENKFTIRFEIPEEQYAAIQLWNNRKKLTSTTDLKQSLCLSFGCYSTETSKAANSLTELSALPSCWPQTGGLFMNVLYKGQRKNFLLSPPFKIAPNGLVDVSEFLQPGSNIIELTQRLDMRGFIFILRAHYPTQGQLEEVSQRHKKNQGWQDWLHHVCRPLDVPIPVFS